MLILQFCKNLSMPSYGIFFDQGKEQGEFKKIKGCQYHFWDTASTHSLKFKGVKQVFSAKAPYQHYRCRG